MSRVFGFNKKVVIFCIINIRKQKIVATLLFISVLLTRTIPYTTHDGYIQNYTFPLKAGLSLKDPH